MAIGDECCLGVSNAGATRRTTESLLGSETVDSSFAGVGGGLHVNESSVCSQQTSNTTKENKEALASENDPQNHFSAVTRAGGCSQIHAGSEKEIQDCSSTEGEPMCASGILCSGVKPCSMSEFVSTVSDCSTTGPVPAPVGIGDTTTVVDEKTNIDNNSAIDGDLEYAASVTCPTKPDEEVRTVACVTVEQMEIDNKEPDNSETQEKMEEDERSISPDEEGSKCSQSSDNGYASDSSNSDVSDNESSRAKSADEESSSSDDDESSPNDSPSPPSADESSPFPCVEEVETRTGISFERTLNNSSQNDNCSAFSFSSPSANGVYASSGAGHANNGKAKEAACERAQLRLRVMGLLDGAVRIIDDSERCLRRYVLLKTNLNRLRKEVRDERLGVHRRRRHQTMAQGFAEVLSTGNGMTLGPIFPYGAPNSISPLAGQVSSSSRSAAGALTTTYTVSSSSSSPCTNRALGSDGDDEEPPMKRPRYAAEENKENYGSSGSVFLTSMHQYSSEAPVFYGTSSGHYSSVCSNSNGGYYSTPGQSMYCMNHLTNHCSASSTNYFTNSSNFGSGSSTQYMSSFNCSGSQTNNDRISSTSSSSSSNGSNSINGGNLSNTNNAAYSSSCAQVDSFFSPVTSGNDAGSSSGSHDSSSSANNGGFYNASNVTPSSCRNVGLSSNLDTIIEAIDQQILRGSYNSGTSRPLSSGASHTSSFGSFPSYSTGGGFFNSSSDNQSGSHIFSNTEGSSYHIFGNHRHSSTSNSVFGDSNSSSYNMGLSSTSYNPSYSSSSSHYSDGSSSSLAPQNPCGRSQLSGNDFQSLVYSSLMASLES